MDRINKLSFLKKVVSQDVLRVDLSNERINVSSTLIRYRDKDTQQIVLYIPSLDISGYGSTEKRAREILLFSINEFVKHLFRLSQRQLDVELLKLGWKQNKFISKEYAKSFVSIDGELMNFNAIDDEVEFLTIEA